MGDAEIATFLTHLARDRNVASSTQNQAFSVPSTGPTFELNAKKPLLSQAAFE